MSTQLESNPTRVERKYTHIGHQDFHVTLIRPPAVWSAGALNISSLTPPIALAYLSSQLIQEGFSVTNIDAIGEGVHVITRVERNPTMEAQGLTIESIIERIPEDTDLIGFSSMFSLEWPNNRDLINQIKKHFPQKIIIAGGEHVSAMPEYSLNDCEGLDYIIRGEGEQLLIEFIHRLRNNAPLDNMPGLVHRGKLSNDDSEGMVANLMAKKFESFARPADKKTTHGNYSYNFEGASGLRVKDVDNLKWPAWHITPIDSYIDEKLTFGRYVGKTMPILGSRGCPYECTFCSNPQMWGRRYQTRDAADVVREIQYYKDTYGAEAIEFYDLTPIISKKWIIEFCDELIKQNVTIKWQISGGTRTEAIDEEVIVKAKAAGCEYLGFAPESGSQRVLNRIKKRVDLKRMIWLLKLARKHNIDTRCNIVIGFPEDTRWDIFVSLWFQVKLALRGVVDSPIFEFTPYPGSLLFEQLRADNVIGEINDHYFETLGLNVQIQNRVQYCRQMKPAELFVYRVVGMTVFYGIYYLLRPLKLMKFIGNLVRYNTSNSVFEQRIIQNTKKQIEKVFSRKASA